MAAAAGSFVRPSFVSSLLLVVLSSFALSSYSMKYVPIKDLCSSHRNPSFCEAFLNSKPGGGDLLSQGVYVIETTGANTSYTLNLIRDLKDQTTDPTLKQHYTLCYEVIYSAKNDLQQAETDMYSGDYISMSQFAFAVMTDLDKCDSDKAAADPSPLPEKTNNLEDLSGIVTIIASYLMQN